MEVVVVWVGLGSGGLHIRLTKQGHFYLFLLATSGPTSSH